MKKMFLSLAFLVMFLTVLLLVAGAANIYGDTNSDGRVDSVDIVKLAQYFAKWNVTLTADEMAAADVYKDNFIDSKDAVRFAQYLAGWDVVLGDGSSTAAPLPEVKISAGNLKTEYMEDPLGVSVVNPRFSWEVTSEARAQVQKAYQIEVRDAGGKIVWDTGKVYSNETTSIEYGGESLSSMHRYTWHVRLWDKDNSVSEWESATFETALRDSDWSSAKWIGKKDDASKTFDPVPMLRKEFSAGGKEIKQARVYISGLGYYELTINGERVGDNVIDPLVSTYDNRYFYTTYDVTELVSSSDNAIGVTLGRGFFSSTGSAPSWFATVDYANFNNETPRLRMMLCIDFANGETLQVVSDNTWKVHDSATIVDQPFYGEIYDARLEETGWDTPAYDDSSWENAVVVGAPAGVAEPQAADANKVVEVITPVSVTNPSSGVYVFDVGRVITGWAEITVNGTAGKTVTIQYAEKKNSNGLIDRTGLGEDWSVDGLVLKGQTDVYTLKGGAEETWEPSFTFKGFQYIQVTGFPGTPTVDSIKVKVVNAAVKETGEFTSSNELFNKIHEISAVSLLNNLHSYPSDTPVFENLGYLGDGHVTQEMGMYNFDMIRYYEKWAKDIIDSVASNGAIGDVAPAVNPSTSPNHIAQEWVAAVVLVPWQSYEISGNVRVLEDAYDTMKKTFAYVKSNMSNGISNSYWGDHANSSASINKITGTAYSYVMADIIAKAAEVLGKTADITTYRNEAETIKTAFNNTFYDVDQGFYAETMGGAFYQTAQVLPLAFGMVPEENVERVLYELGNRTKAFNTGIYGTKYIFRALTEAGYGDVAYNLVNTDKTGYGYIISLGATSLWEYFYTASRSFDHHMFGTVDDWFYETLAGINYEGAGFSTSVIKPYAAGDLTNVSASINTVRGKIASAWTKAADGTFTLNVTIPANTTATVYVPTNNAATVKEGGVLVSGNAVEGVEFLRQEDGFAVYSVGSGEYSFTSEYAAPSKAGADEYSARIVENFADIGNIFDCSAGLIIESSEAENFGGDKNRLSTLANTDEFVIYHLSEDIEKVIVEAYRKTSISDWKNRIEVAVSANNSSYTTLDVNMAILEDSNKGCANGWTCQSYTFPAVPAGMRFLKITIKNSGATGLSEFALGKLTLKCEGSFVSNSIKDDLVNFNKMYSFSGGLSLGTDASGAQNNDANRVFTAAPTNETIVYMLGSDIKSIKAISYRGRDTGNWASRLGFAVSPDNVNWTPLEVNDQNCVSSLTGNEYWRCQTYSFTSIPAGIRYVKISINNSGCDNYWEPQLGYVEISGAESNNKPITLSNNITDPMQNTDHMVSMSSGLSIATDSAAFANGDAGRVHTKGSTNEAIIYRLGTDIKGAKVISFRGRDTSNWPSRLQFAVSANGGDWTTLNATTSTESLTGDENWRCQTYIFEDIPEGMRYFKIMINNSGCDNYWEPQIGYVEICDGEVNAPDSIEDELENTDKMYAYSDKMEFWTDATDYTSDPSRICAPNATDEYIIYKVGADVTRIEAVSVRGTETGSWPSRLQFAVSPDNSTWTMLEINSSTSTDSDAGIWNWRKQTYTFTDIPAGMRYVKVMINNAGVDNPWEPQLGLIKINPN